MIAALGVGRTTIMTHVGRVLGIACARPVAAGAAAMVLLLTPAPAAAQEEPMHVCTELTLPYGEGSAEPEASSAPLTWILRGQPADGTCDVIVYLPVVLADGQMFRDAVT